MTKKLKDIENSITKCCKVDNVSLTSLKSAKSTYVKNLLMFATDYCKHSDRLGGDINYTRPFLDRIVNVFMCNMPDSWIEQHKVKNERMLPRNEEHDELSNVVKDFIRSLSEIPNAFETVPLAQEIFNEECEKFCQKTLFGFMETERRNKIKDRYVTVTKGLDDWLIDSQDSISNDDVEKVFELLQLLASNSIQSEVFFDIHYYVMDCLDILINHYHPTQTEEQRQNHITTVFKALRDNKAAIAMITDGI